MNSIPFISPVKQITVCLAILLTGFASCHETEDYVEASEVSNTVTISLTDDGGSALVSLAGVTAGAFFAGSNGDVASSIAEVGKGGTIVLPASARQGNVVVCTPWQDEWTVSGTPTNLAFRVEADQTMPSAYQASDLMAGRAATGVSSVVMKHLLARIVVHVVDETGNMDFSHISPMLQNMKDAVGVNLQQQLFTTQESMSNIKMNAYATTDRRLSAQAIVAPQTIAAGTQLIAVQIYGSLQWCPVTEHLQLTGGNTYTFSVRLTETGLVPDGCQISDWEDDGGGTLTI